MKNEIVAQIQYFASKLKKEVKFMEVCGGHTHAIFEHGIRALLPSNIKLLSGPGCPVCVTGRDFIDKAIAYTKLSDVIIATFGDLIRVPGSYSTLEKERANGADIQIVLSSFQALEIAKKNKKKKVIFLGIGFETTAPGSALALIQAKKEKIKNFFVLSAHKLMPPAMKALLDDEVKIDGYIAPGHVSTITGSHIFEFIPSIYKIPVVVSGFEALDMFTSISMLLRQIVDKAPKVEIQYSRAVTSRGNIKAIKLLNQVFRLEDAWWRGLGNISNSGYGLKSEFEKFDASLQIPIKVGQVIEPDGCICGEILKGLKTPNQCPLFSKVCTPQNPVGSCMVSSEGACNAFYKYNLKFCIRKDFN